MDRTPNEKARQYFKDAGLCYPISKQDWRMLITILEKHLDKRNEEVAQMTEGKRDYVYKLDKCIYNKETKHRPFCAYINVKVDNYSVREGISFNTDGFIGFAGWASSYNTILFTDAFMEWVDYMKDKNAKETSLKHQILSIINSNDNVIERIKELCSGVV